MCDKPPVMLSHAVTRFLRKIRAITIGNYAELLDVFLFQSGKHSRVRPVPHPLAAGPIPLAPPRNEAADNDLPGNERTFLHLEPDAIGLVIDDVDHLHRLRYSAALHDLDNVVGSVVPFIPCAQRGAVRLW